MDGKTQFKRCTSSACKRTGAVQQNPSWTAANVPQQKSECTGAISSCEPPVNESLAKWGRPCTLRCPAYSRIKAVGWIETAIKVGQCGFRTVNVSDVVLRWTFGSACVEELQQAILQCSCIGAFAKDIVLMKNMAEEMTVVQSV